MFGIGATILVLTTWYVVAMTQHFFSNIFNPCLVESVDTEPTDAESCQ